MLLSAGKSVQQTSQVGFSRNRLLSTLPQDDFKSLKSDLERVDLPARLDIEGPNEAIRHIYFPEPSVVSVVAETRTGGKLEVGIFGPEGMSGLAILHDADRSPLHTFVQVPGSGIRIAVERFRAVLDRSPTLQAHLLRFAQAFSIQVAYTALANGRYTIEQRLARWLLMCHDRVDGDTLLLTHEFLAMMLGVRRAGITTALQVLEGSGMIRSRRGRVDIVDRERLLGAAGGSYGVPESEYERLFEAG